MKIPPESVPVAAFIAALRSELRVAADDSATDMPIVVEQVVVEFTMTARRSTDAKAGIKFWLVDVGGGIEGEHSSGQRVTLTLLPRQADGRALQVNDFELEEDEDVEDNEDDVHS